jgi:hypothetical protein
MSTFHLHVHTGRGLPDLLAEAFELLESGVRPHLDDYAPTR